MILKHSIKVRQRLAAKTVILAFSGTLLLAAPVTIYMLNFGNSTSSMGSTGPKIADKTASSGTASVEQSLPVKLVSYKGQQTGEYVLLTWTSATEIGNSYFSLEKSNDGVNFTDMGKVHGSGNSNTLKNYHLLDVKPADGINYYRLKQTDTEGKQEVLKTIQVNTDKM